MPLPSTTGGEVVRVTGCGLADRHNRSISPRANPLIAIAHPQFRSELARRARPLDSP